MYMIQNGRLIILFDSYNSGNFNNASCENVAGDNILHNLNSLLFTSLIKVINKHFTWQNVNLFSYCT